MNPQDPLAQLRDIHLPEPVHWWPPAPGWWVVTFIALAAVIWVIYRVISTLRQNRYRRVALNKITSMQCSARENTKESLVHVSVILRRVAVQSYGRQAVSPLVGDEWLQFLDRTGETKEFTHGAAKVLGTELYRKKVDADLEKVMAITKKWIKEHRA